MGALISEQHMAKVKGYVKRAMEKGATVLCGEGKDKVIEAAVEGLPPVSVGGANLHPPCELQPLSCCFITPHDIYCIISCRGTLCYQQS